MQRVVPDQLESIIEQVIFANLCNINGERIGQYLIFKKEIAVGKSH